MSEKIKTFWFFTADQILAELESGPGGISDDEATRRLVLGGNKKRERSSIERDILLFLSQFWNPLVLLLVVAVILSAVLGEASDVTIIILILLVTGTLSFWQERNAGRAVEKLRSIIRVTSSVLRSGQWVNIEASQIVKGDIIRFTAGDIIPADCLLIEEKDLHTNEASLTGESYPAEKSVKVSDIHAPLSKRNNVLFQGTSVISGNAKAVVVLTGTKTEFGKISSGMSKPSEETAFEKGVRNFGYLLMQITIVLSIIILGVNIYFGKPIIDSLLFALALTVGMAPELLPAIMTIAMSSGAHRMAAKKVIVKKLSSIQNLGEVDLLCSDKTGTITEGVITVAGIYDLDGKKSDKAKLFAFLNASFESGFVNPLDEAVRKIPGLSVEGYIKADEVPYDFIRKRLSIEVRNEGDRILITKGALSNILQICSSIELNGITEPIQSRLDAINHEFKKYSDEGFRTIGICYRKIIGNNTLNKDEEMNMTFLGFILLSDPPKVDIMAVISKLKERGVRLKLITGDNRYVASYVSKSIGLENVNVLTGEDISEISAEALSMRVESVDIFAEIEPNQKELLIRAFQKNGNVVAYMGDGINDVSAIHAADVGISTNNAVDVAKEAADVVLLEKELEVLIDGIIEGRRTFINTLKYIFINTSATFGNMFSMAGISMLLPFLPMLPKQILLTNFMTDFPYMAVANDNVDEERLMKPQKWDTRLIRNFMIVFGLQSSIFDFVTFYFLYTYFHVGEAVFRTGWFIESILTELLILFIVRTYRPFFVSRPGKWMLILSVLSLFITIALPYSPVANLLGLSPMSLKVLICIIGITALYGVMSEFAKRRVFRKMI